MTKFARAVPVLMYHHISTSPGMITVSPEHFAAQMAYLAGAGYTTIGSAQLSAYLAGEPLPKKAVVLTFDDGYLGASGSKGHGLTALCFLVTSWIGEGPVRAHARSGGEVAIENGEPDPAILRRPEIDAMREARTFEFHSHTDRRRTKMN
ncbi:polysaccharide deacetylase family protein [Paraburkholderia aromaticivorans]|uniref:polysaccharide deacetylase family protein n=1 Tax=Paraburkholderia aromaticivorans TaxID=2026199 RepID=UPI001F10513B|nr:polysaccharide deacetylase family protein [Paraburkholderia aromaticivorans]